MKYKIQLLSFFILTTGCLYGQVAVGTEKAREKAALLELSNPESNTDDATSIKGGMLLPRVVLVSLQTLEPFVSTTDAEWMNAAKKEVIMKEHTGLEVYNLTDNTVMQPGTYVWNGTEWEPLFKALTPRVLHQLVLPFPAFNLPLIDPEHPESTRLKVDLYEKYVLNLRMSNFTTNMEEDVKTEFIHTHYFQTAEQLDYIVTHYDKDIITIHSISNSGIMEYTVHNINPGPSSFLNIYVMMNGKN